MTKHPPCHLCVESSCEPCEVTFSSVFSEKCETFRGLMTPLFTLTLPTSFHTNKYSVFFQNKLLKRRIFFWKGPMAPYCQWEHTILVSTRVYWLPDTPRLASAAGHHWAATSVSVTVGSSVPIENVWIGIWIRESCLIGCTVWRMIDFNHLVWFLLISCLCLLFPASKALQYSYIHILNGTFCDAFRILGNIHIWQLSVFVVFSQSFRLIWRTVTYLHTQQMQRNISLHLESCVHLMSVQQSLSFSSVSALHHLLRQISGSFAAKYSTTFTS